MEPSSPLETSPFIDSLQIDADDATLSLGRQASLSLGTESMIVLDESFHHQPERGTPCCAEETKTTRAIPYSHVLWASLLDSELVVSYAQATSKTTLQAETFQYPVEQTQLANSELWIAKLLDRAYYNTKRRKRIKILINPFGGKGHAARLFTREIEPLLAAAQCKLNVERTQYSGHAVEIAEKLDIDAYDVVASCSGDGLPHEVFNGLGRRPDARQALETIAVVQLPCGSGNAMSLNLTGSDSPSIAALWVIKGIRTPLDLMSVTQGERRMLSFLSQSMGLIAGCDLGTENMRWMGGARFTVGGLLRIAKKSNYPCDLAVQVAIEDKPSIKEHYRRELGNHATESERRGRLTGEGLPPLHFGSVKDPLPPGWEMVPYNNMGTLWAGNMGYMSADTNCFPAALPSDGYIDLVCINGDAGRINSLQALMAAEDGPAFFGLPVVNYQKVYAYRVIPRATSDRYISIDGESVPFEPYQVEMHKGLGTVLSKSGHNYEASGVCLMP
ncbi:MAG: sphinganine kinase lcb4 [Trizodia sp. TS-e1964]|nr:MAG: sphinganine kinase lcb4 [Trizodia sp. TS-e1964]